MGQSVPSLSSERSHPTFVNNDLNRYATKRKQMVVGVDVHTPRHNAVKESGIVADGIDTSSLAKITDPTI